MYKVEYLESVLQEDLPKISHPERKRIRKAIEDRLQTKPLDYGKPLQYSLKGCRRLRVGDFRVIYRIEDETTVLLVKIGHRREVYD